MSRDRRRGARGRRSAGEWAVRGGLALLALLLGYASVTRSLADLVKQRDPARAHALAPGDGRITALLAERRFADDPTPGAQGPVVRLATLALRQDPMAVPAVAALGFATQLRGDVPGARHLFAYSQHLSRRHLPTQLWAIEDAVGRGDVPGTLRHYDIALRTSKSAPDLLFPVLATAIDDPAVQSALVATMAGRPAWAHAFVVHAATTRNDPRATAALFLGLQQSGLPVAADAGARLIDRLVEAGAAPVAWRYYAATHPGANPRRSRDPGFAADPRSPSRFDWIPVDDGTASSSIQRAGEGGVFDFAVPSGNGGPLLRQMQVLPAGTYRLAGHGTGIRQPAGSLPYWTLTCNDGRELGRVNMANETDGGGGFAGTMAVPATCPIQLLTLVARSSDEVAGSTGQVDRIEVTPAEGGAR